MSAEEHKTLVRRFIEEVFNKENLARADEYIANDAVDHAAFPGQAPGLEGWKQTRAMFFAAFPDLQITIEDQIAEGDKVAGRYTMRGTHQGEFIGIPPTGRQITITAIDVIRVANGKLVEHWANLDQMGMLQQLGVIPAPGQAAVGEDQGEPT